MGRSRSRKTTRTVSSNHRLRSSSNTSSYSPSPIPYDRRYTLTRFGNPSPSPNSQRVSRLSKTYVPTYTSTPRQLPRSQPSRIRVYNAPPQAVSRQQAQRDDKPSQAAQDSKTLVCVRRNQRREILHATRKTGKSGQATPVFTAASKIFCRKKG